MLRAARVGWGDAGRAKPRSRACRAGQSIDFDELNVLIALYHQLGDAIPRGDCEWFVSGVEQDDFDLSAIAGVDGARCVQHRDAVFGGQPAARVHQTDQAGWQSDAHSGANHGPTMSWNHCGFGRREICTGVTGPCIGGRSGADVQHFVGRIHVHSLQGRQIDHTGHIREGLRISMLYSERLRPHGGAYLALVLIIPAFAVVFYEVQPIVGYIVGPSLYVLIFLISWFASPVISVSDEQLFAGRARIPLAALGEVTVYRRGDEALEQLRGRLDVRAYLCVRGGVDLVRVEVTDPEDPTPYWLLGSRHADELAAELRLAQAAQSLHTGPRSFS